MLLWMNANGILPGSRIIFTVPQKYILEYREPAKPKRWESLSIYIFDLQMNHTVTHFHAYSVTCFWLLVWFWCTRTGQSTLTVLTCVCVLERERENERERAYDQSHMDPSWCHSGKPLTPPSLSLYRHLSGLLSSSSLCFLAGSGENLDHTSCCRITAGLGSVWCHRSRGAQVRPLLFY